jgi:iron uptake system component EfeO
VAVTAVATALTGASSRASPPSPPRRFAESGPAATERAAAATVTAVYRSAATSDAAGLVTDVSRLALAVHNGDVSAAQSAELAAQGEFDEIRFVDAASPQNVASVDALAGAVPPGATFGGLHALERDLWSAGDAAADLPSLQAQTAVARDLVARQALSPATVMSVAVSELSWVVDIAVPEQEELYSHDDDVDIAAGLNGANQAFAAAQPLACTVEAVQCRTVAADLASLTSAVAALGPPADVPDSALTASVQRNLSEQADRAADALAALEVPLLPWGTAGPQPYGAAAVS